MIRFAHVGFLVRWRFALNVSSGVDTHKADDVFQMVKRGTFNVEREAWTV